jgi:serine/threonine-protein kinase
MPDSPQTTQHDPHRTNLRPVELAAPARAELVRRWQNGERIGVEALLAQHPALADPDALLDLLFAEVALREQHGERPTVAEYQQRFPQHADRLSHLFQARCSALAPAVSLSAADSQPAPGPDAGCPTAEAPGIRLRSLPDREQMPLKPPPADLPTGRYELLGEIARGGMGVVLLARDPALGRELALKVLLDRRADHPEIQRRFLEEAQVAGQLQHPGIVPIHELGRFPDGRAYFTMKLIEGRTLAALLRERPDPGDELPHFLKVFEQVCQAVAYAHAHGVVHRDLKPLNVMVGAFGEVQVMDWGLAKVVGPSTRPDVLNSDALLATTRDYVSAGAEADCTQPGQVLGTPAYMPPEQARGEIELLDERADVFGLGAILCEILTGSPPYRGAGTQEVLQRAVRADLSGARERLDGCGADADLIVLARACLSPSREDRPPNAGAVVEALTGYLAGVQERLRQAEIERAAAQARAAEERKRRQVQLALAATVLLAVVAGGGGWWWQAQVKARRVSESTSAVQDAFQEATQKHEQARAGGLDPAAWTGAVAAVAKAEALLTEEVEVRVRRQVEELAIRVRADERETQAKTEQAARDHALLRRFDALRLEFPSEHESEARWWKRIGAGYVEAFREYGLDIDRIPPEETVKFLQARPENVRMEVINAVDLWVGHEWMSLWEGVGEKLAGGKPLDALSAAAAVMSLPGRQLGVWRRRLGVLQEVDPIEDRRKLRAAALRLDIPGLLQLTRELKLARLPPATLQLLTLILIYTKQEGQAAQMLQEAAELHPDDFWIHFCLAALHQSNETALRAAEVALALRPNIPEACFFKGIRLRNGRDYDAARRAFTKGLELRPYYPLCLAGLASVCRLQKQPLEEALPCFRRATEKNPNDPFPWQLLAEALEKLGRLDELHEVASQAVRLHPKSGGLHYYLAVYFEERKEYAEGVKACRKAVELSPEHRDAWDMLGRLLEKTNQPNGALAAYREAMQRDAELAGQGRLGLLFKHEWDAKTAATQGRLGLLLKAEGDSTAALAALRESVKLNAKQPEVQRGLAELCEAVQDWEGAVTAWRAVREQVKEDADAARRLARAMHTLEVRLEAEGLTVLRKSGDFGVFPQDMKPFKTGKWSGDKQLFANPTAPGAWTDLEIPIPADGKYRPIAFLTRSSDFGIVQLYLNGQRVGEPFDGYHPQVASPRPAALGTVELKKGKAILRIEVIGADPKAAKGCFYWGLDCLDLNLVPPATP